MADSAFPQELLSQPSAERLQYFHRFTMAHPQLQETKDALMTAIEDAAPGSLVFVFGPSGVGKTTLRLRAEQLLIQKMLPELDADPGLLPYVSIEAMAPDSGVFNWKEHFRRILVSMEEPFIGFRAVLPLPAPKPDSSWFQMPNSMGMSSRLRYTVEQALSHRRPQAVFLDEAQHLAKMPTGRRLLDQLDVLKSIASRTRTLHILVGTYDLLFFRNLSGQLSRRSVSIHFPRYRLEQDEDIGVFQNVLLTFQHQLPLEQPPDLMACWQFLYERSIGCVGVLKEWLGRALARVLREHRAILTREHLESTALSAAQCQQMLAEARAGEKMLAECEGSCLRLRQELGFRDDAAHPAVHRSPEAKSVPIVSARTRKGQRGQRRVQRDRIGHASRAYA